MNLFGRRKKKPKTVNPTETINELKDAQDMLDKQEMHLEKQIKEAQRMIRQKVKEKNKNGAKFYLKRKKMLVKKRDNIYGQKHNLDVQIEALSNLAQKKSVFSIMQKAKIATAANLKAMDPDKVGDLMEDVQEQVEMVNEIDEAMGQTIGDDVDDEELEQELADMDNQMLDEDLLRAPSVPVSDRKVEAKDAKTVPAKREPERKVPVLAGSVAAAAPAPPAQPKPAKKMSKLDALTADLGI